MSSGGAWFTTNGGESLYLEYPVKDKLEKLLFEKTKAAGRVLTYEEFAKYPDMPKPNDFAHYCGGSFSKLAEEAYKKTEHYKNSKMREKLEPKKEYTEAEVRQILGDFFKNRHFMPSPSQLRRGKYEGLPPLEVVQQFLGETMQDWTKEILKDRQRAKAIAEEEEEKEEETPATENSSTEEKEEETHSIEKEEKEEETPNTEEVQVVKHESDSGEVTIEVTINLPNLKKPIKILIPA